MDGTGFEFSLKDLTNVVTSATLIVAYVLSYGQVINVRWFLFYLANEATKAVGHQVPLDAFGILFLEIWTPETRTGCQQNRPTSHGFHDQNFP